MNPINFSSSEIKSHLYKSPCFVGLYIEVPVKRPCFMGLIGVPAKRPRFVGLYIGVPLKPPRLMGLIGVPANAPVCGASSGPP